MILLVATAEPALCPFTGLRVVVTRVLLLAAALSSLLAALAAMAPLDGPGSVGAVGAAPAVTLTAGLLTRGTGCPCW